jgi:hypothetical protein
VQIEEMMQQLAQMGEVNGEITIKRADNLVQLASDIVETLTGEKIEN